MPSRPLTKPGIRKLSDVARHLVLPDGIVSTGYPAVRDQCRRMGIVHDEWQAGLGRAMLAKRSSGLYAAGIGGVVISICRQVGKTFTLGSIIFALCILFPGTKVLWTAHRTRTGSETFRGMKGLSKRKLIAPHVTNVRSANGEQEIEFRNGSRILFGAREAGFGRGFDDVDLIVFDEAQILTQRALDDMVPAASVAANPLIIYIGTPPKPTDPSEVFTTRRAEALAVKEKMLAAGLSGMGDTLYVEVSADPDADPDDRKQWEKGNPSYPLRVPEHAMLRNQLNLGPESFLREGLGIWDDVSVLNGVFDQVEWAKSRDSIRGMAVAVPAGPVSVGVAFSTDHAWASVGWAWESDQWTFADVVRGEGTDWVLPYLVERASRRSIKTVAVDQAGPAGTMLAAMGAAKLPVRTTGTGEWKTACADLANLVHIDRFVHRGDEALNTAAARARWRQVGDGRVFARRDSGVPIDPLEAVAAAVWGLTPDPKQKEFFMLNLNDFA